MHPDAIGLGDLDGLDFSKAEGLIPAIVQHADTGLVLMLGYMNREALQESLRRGRVVFFSRSRKRLWEKGESSGNRLTLSEIRPDCDRDALLIFARPEGPTCHLGTASCFGIERCPDRQPMTILSELERVIAERMTLRPEGSYTSRLFDSGIRRIAQKVGEEGLEVALAAVGGSECEMVSECADLLYHLLVLLKARGSSLSDVLHELRARQPAPMAEAGAAV
jgi:phosphoribosyl-AMP cyclohydrolase / phosphoribosyl-ATP pyrophosphohydrolase